MKKKSKVLTEALEHLDQLPDNWFGDESATFEMLPSVASKKETIRTSTYLNKDDLQYLKLVSKKTHVPVAHLTGEIVAKFVEEAKKKKA